MEKSPDCLAQGGERDRLAKDHIDCRRLRSRHLDQGAKAGEHDHRDVFIHLFDKARSLIAAHLRHDAVEDNEVEEISAKFFQSLAAARRRRYHVSIAAQIGGNDLEDTRFIINNEDTE